MDTSMQVFQFKTTTPQKKNNDKGTKINSDENAINLIDLMHRLNQISTDIYLIDVREEYEYQDFNIGGVNIPLYELVERKDEIPLYKTLVFCCQSSQRSKLATKIIKPHYEGEVLYLKDGVLA